MKKGIKIYLVVLACTAIGISFTNNVISNFFKEAYHVTAQQRGYLEVPREAPGLLLIIIIALLASLSNVKISMIAQLLSAIGILMLGLFSPVFSVMAFFVFVNSLGMHMFFPMQSAISLSLSEPDKVGKRMGQFKGVSTAFEMIGALLIFIGFKAGWFSFKTDFKLHFIVAGLLFLVVFVLLIYLNKEMNTEKLHPTKAKFIIRKEYKYYYVLVVMFGVQKQMMMVYGPWVLIELLNKNTSDLALLGMIGMFVGIFFIPAVGRWIDKFGVKKLLIIDALSFIGVYFMYGILSAGYYNGSLAIVGIPALMASILFILDRMSTQLGIVRTVYLQSIVVSNDDITPTLSLGISLDHIMSITFAIIGGIVWNVAGPQYIFFLVAGLSFVNLYVALKID